jgi:hypothetical protein
MNRRTFLKQVGTLTAAIVIPNNALAESFLSLTEVKSAGNVTINAATKTIHINPDAGTMTVLEFHRWLMNLWDEPDMMELDNPSDRYTDHHIRLVNGWRVSDESLHYLTDGSLMQNVDEYYLSYYRAREL